MVKRIFIITIVLALTIHFLPASVKLLITRYPRIIFLLPLQGINKFLSNVRIRQKEYSTLSEFATELKLENAQLKEKLQSEKFMFTSNRPNLIHAHIIARDNESGIRYLTVDKSIRDNVKKNMPVMTAYGLVGKIIESTETQSVIETALSPSLKISALNTRSNVIGVVEYSHFNKLRFKYAFAESDIQTNDTIITSGLGGIFPRGLCIGIVLTVDVDPTSFFQYVDVKPMNNFNTLEHVFIDTREITPFNEQRIKYDRPENLNDIKIETPIHPRIR